MKNQERMLINTITVFLDDLYKRPYKKTKRWLVYKEETESYGEDKWKGLFIERKSLKWNLYSVIADNKRLTENTERLDLPPLESDDVFEIYIKPYYPD